MKYRKGQTQFNVAIVQKFIFPIKRPSGHALKPRQKSLKENNANFFTHATFFLHLP